MTLLQRGHAAVPAATAPTVTATWRNSGGSTEAPASGSTLIAFHRYHAGPTARTVPTGWTEVTYASWSTFITLQMLTRTAGASEPTTVTFGPSGVGSVKQEATLLAFPSGGGVDVATPEDSNGAITSFPVGPTPGLASGTKALVVAAGLVNASGGWGAAPSGYQKLAPESELNDALSVSYRAAETSVDPQTATVTWTTATGAAGIIASVTYTPVVATALQWIYRRTVPFVPGGGGNPGGEIVKTAVPIFRDQLGWYVNNFTLFRGVSQPGWDEIATWYRYGHVEGHNFSGMIDADGLTPANKFELGRTSTHRTTIYDNGSYVTQGRPWEVYRVAAHAERISPKGLAVLHIATPATLNVALTETATTIQIKLPTQKPATLPTTHPSGTPAMAYWPFIASTLAPTTPEVRSRSTSEYVSWVRVGDEMIGLPVWGANWSINAAQTVATITGITRGWARTERRAHVVNSTVWSPSYVGSNAATEADKVLSGNPIVHSTGGLRYTLAFYDRNRRNEDVATITTGHDSLRVIADVGTMEAQGAVLGAAKKIISISDNGTMTTGTLAGAITAHGYADGDRVMFGGADIAPGVTALRQYFVRDATANTFRIAETVDGLALEVAKPPRIWGGGVWLLQQINTLSQWNSNLSAMSAVLDEPSCVGLSMRMSWSAYEADPTLLQRGYDLATSKGKKFMFRFMAGEHTPARVFTAGAYSFQSNLGTEATPRWETIPKPFSNAGVGGNPVFEQNYDALLGQLAAWSRARGIRILHSAWYGWKWSEFYNGEDLVGHPADPSTNPPTPYKAPADGYSWAAALEGHRRLKRIDRKHSDFNLLIEHALSGHSDDPNVDEWGDLITMLISVYGPKSEALMTQGNNMNDQPNTLGHPNVNLLHSKQSVSSTEKNYNWNAIFDAWDNWEAQGRPWAYMEIYTAQWTGGTSATLRSRALQKVPAPMAPVVPGDMVVTNLRRAPSNPVADGIELDVTSVDTYNVSDAYANDIKANNTPAIGGSPWSFLTRARADWPAVQAAKRTPLQQLFTERGLPASTALVANNYLAQPGTTAEAIAARTARINGASTNEYDGYLFEHGSMEPGSLPTQLTQLCQIHGGLNSAGVQVNPAGHKAIWWLKYGDWKGGVFSDSNGAQYNRLGFGMFFLTWRSTSTNPILQGRFFDSSIEEYPSDGAGHHIFNWPFGVPTTQLGGKPMNPNSEADIYQAATGLYLRRFTQGIILVNTAAVARSYTLTEPYYDVLSEVAGNGVLVNRTTGYVVTVPPYDMAFLVKP